MNEVAKTYFEKFNLIPITGNIVIKNSKKTFDRASYKHINKDNCLSEVNNKDNCISIIPKHNNLVVLDIDNLQEFENFKKEFNINEPDTVKEKTKKGVHYYFKITDDQKKIITKNITKVKNFNIDIIYNTLIFMTPSKYKQDNQIYKYTWVSDFELGNKEFQQVPEWILNLYSTKKEFVELPEEINNKIKQILSENKLRELIFGLNKSRSDNRDFWLRVGFFLSSYSYGYKIFKDFSKQSDKYDPERFELDWESFKSGEKDINIGTILKWLKEDNLNLYNNFIEENKILKEINETTKEYGITHNEIVKRNKKEIIASHDPELKTIKAIHDMQSKMCKNPVLRSICTKNGIFAHCTKCNFQFPEKSIVIDKTNAPTIYNTLIVNITEDINNKDTTQVVKILKDRFQNRIIFNNGSWYLYNNDSGIYEKKAEELIRLEIDNLVNEMKDLEENNEDWINWMQKIGYKDNIVKELKIYCYNEEKLDDREYLLGFENGVLDLENNIFRKGNKNEYITMKCNMQYDEIFDTSLAEEILKDIFQDHQEYIYALNIFSLCLRGKNFKQKITMNYGFSASNGKSFLMERFKNIFGDYGDMFNVNLLTSKNKSAGDANSTLINFKNKRFLYCSEPETNQKLNINLIKTLTGDTIKARGLYEKQETLIKPTYNIFMCCNALPKPDNEDNGFNRRINIIEYKTRFLESPKKKEDKLLKEFNENDLKNIEYGLMYLLVKNYFLLKQNTFKIDVPQIIKNIINIYTNENTNEIIELLTDHYVNGNDKDYILVKDIKILLKSNNITMDTITIINIIKMIFPDSEYYEIKCINYKNYRNVISYIKNL